MSTPAKFGKFASLSDFLESYKAAEKKKFLKPLLSGAPALSLKKIKTAQKKKQRDVVEIEATLKVREPDDVSGDKHYHLRIVVTKIIVDDPDVSKDLKDAKAKAREVFVAIRFGDSMGVQEEIKGLKAGAALKLKGEWITKEKALAHGGEKMSVLHFTHHPLGFVCTPVKCYM
jgi:hypothetical protein